MRARRVRSEPAEDVFARIDAAPAPTFAAAPPPELTAEERDAALEDIIQQIIADPNAGALPALQIHQDFLVRCRIKRLGPDLPDAHTFRRRMTIARARATALDNADDLKWTRAIEISDRLPDDMRGPFLMLARAAVTENVCPTDDEIARFFGSHSPGRARRLLSNMEADRRHRGAHGLSGMPDRRLPGARNRDDGGIRNSRSNRTPARFEASAAADVLNGSMSPAA